MKEGQVEICRECRHARRKTWRTVECIRYGIIIGYTKSECRGFEREQIPEQKDGV